MKNRFFKNFVKRAQARDGIAMTELVLALVVIGILLTPIFRNYNKGKENTRANETQTVISTSVAGIQDLFRGQSYTDMTALELVTAGAFPKELLKGATLFNAWGGTLSYGVIDVSTFSLTIDKVPMSSCVKLAQFGADWTSVSVNGSTHTDADLPVSPSSAISECNSSTNNTIVYESH